MPMLKSTGKFFKCNKLLKSGIMKAVFDYLLWTSKNNVEHLKIQKFYVYDILFVYFYYYP